MLLLKVSFGKLTIFGESSKHISETMRMYPPAPMMSRYCEETTKLSEELTVEKGTTVVWGTNREF